MKGLLYFSLFCLLSGVSRAEMFGIGGEIETGLRINLQNTDALMSNPVWTGATFRLHLQSEVVPDVYAFAGLRIRPTETAGTILHLSEAYIDYYTDKYDIRGGLQILSWGTAYKINPTNIINPIDIAEEAAFIPEERLGVIAAQVNYYPLDNLTLTAVFIPYFIPAFQQEEQEEQEDVIERTLENSEYAFRVAARSIFRSDISLSYFSGRKDFPPYSRIKMYGADIIRTFRGVTFWAEGAYTRVESGNSIYEVVTGGEYTFGNDLYFMGQIYHSNRPKAEGTYLIAVIRYPFRDIHTLESMMAYESMSGVFIISPQINISLADATSLRIGGIYLNKEIPPALLRDIGDMVFIELVHRF